MADTAVPIDGGERVVDVLSRPAPPGSAALAVALVTALASTGGCDGAGPGVAADGARAPAGTLLATLGTRLAGQGGHAAPDAPRWPADLDFHPGARAGSIELLAAVHDAGGRAISFRRRFDRLALRAPDGIPASGEDFAFDALVRLSGTLAVAGADGEGGGEGGGEGVARREVLERATLGLAGVAPRALWVRDATLALERAPEGGCALDHVLAEADGTALRFRQADCPRAEAIGPLVVATSPTLAVDGTIVLDGARLAVSGAGWVRRVWGDVPPPGGALVFDRLALELDGIGFVDVTRSRRRSGRGPVTTSATLRGTGDTDGGAPGAAGETIAGAGAIDWLDTGAAAGAEGPAAASAWTLRLPALGVDVVLEPFVDAPVERDALGAARRGAVGARGSHAGVGFVEIAVAEPAAGGSAGRTAAVADPGARP